MNSFFVCPTPRLEPTKCRKGKKGKLRRIEVFFGNSDKFHYVCAMVNKRSAPLRVGNKHRY